MTQAVSIASKAAQILKRKERWPLLEIGFWIAAFAAAFLLPGQLLLLTEIAILALFALSLDLLVGYAGILSLGHAAFFGLGAYAAGLFSLQLSSDPVLGLLVAGALSGLLGLSTSFLVLRGSDLTRLMTTFGVSMLLAEAANQAAWLTGGADGLSGISMSPVLGLFEFDLWGRIGYLYCLITLFLLTMIARQLVNSPFGLALKAIRRNPRRAEMLGISTNGRRVVIYTISAIYAGMAGALLAQTTSFVSPDVLAFHRSAEVLLVVVIGGIGYLYGGMVGAMVFSILRAWLSVMTPQYWMFWVGLILVALVLIGRDRIKPAQIIQMLGKIRGRTYDPRT
ncbi:branched-chain amino acid transport system permease protein [Agrobacterium vitis]|nr:branched-chain amino acid transport system permease protein [Agrobacterium vitis]MBE1436604.1 branched-chain amino acid transport system permease protein [Agrobacterium vitis]